MNCIIYALYNEYHMPMISALHESLTLEYCEVIGNAESNTLPWNFKTKTRFHDWHRCLHEYPGVDWSIIRPLDESLIESMRHCEVQILRMMDRNAESLTESWSYNYRKKIYYMHLRYWNHILSEIHFDFFVSLNIPHEIIDFVIFNLCKQRKIRTYFFYQFQPDMMFILRDWGKPLPLPIESPYVEQPNSFILSTRMQEEYNLQTNLSTSSTPFYMQPKKKQSRTALPVKIYQQIRTHAGQILTKKGRQRKAILRSRIKYVHDRLIELGRYEEAPRIGEKYIYLPLHLQPELSTSPMAGAFVEQILIAQLIAANIPKEIKIYVKEHPNQDLAKRSDFFYKEFLQVGNVRLISRQTSSLLLLQNAVAVATATGTAGWEAIFKGKPVLLFGSTFYAEAPGVFKIRTHSDCRAAIHSILTQKSSTSLRPLHNYLRWLDSQIIFGNIDSEYEPASKLSHAAGMKNISDKLVLEIRESK